MNKTEILDAIRRIAASNNGLAPGSQRMATELGLRKADWYPNLWVRWGDAVRVGVERGADRLTLRALLRRDSP